MCDRKWMYERLDGKYLSKDFVNGVSGFIRFASEQDSFKKSSKLKCPCNKCDNRPYLDVDTVKLHLYKEGFRANYTLWICHGEKFPDSGNLEHRSSALKVASNPYHDMIIDASGSSAEDIKEHLINDVVEEPNIECRKFFDMLEKAKEPLYEGCELSVLEAASRLTNIKCEYNIPHRAIDNVASLMKDMCPMDNKMTDTYSKTKKLLEGLELPHIKIDVCPNGCMLFWKEDKDLIRCRMCNSSRYKKNKVSQKVLTYLPITPRLKRLYATKGIANDMRWHSETLNGKGLMSHPREGEAWQNFNETYPDFSSDPRNVRLGLCTDGFAPFGKSGKSYSCWPVILTPYNLPPWLCMKRPFMFLTLIVPGPEYPGKNLDVYLQPLIEELKNLWEMGSLTYDVSTKMNFTMKAALMWTISDFPAYGLLSGWKTSGKLACPYCMDNTNSFYLKHSSKCTWFDCHRQFLPEEHEFRLNRNAFIKNRIVSSSPPRRLNGEEVWECVSNLPKTTDPSFRASSKKRKRNESTNLDTEKDSGWKRQSIFWQLPYWCKLYIRHNLDVMHIEKNVFDQIIHTIMDVKGKTKDTISARKDLARYCKRPKLHIDENIDNAKIVMPKAPYVLNKEEKRVLCEWIKDLKFPDGYSSNLGRCVDMKQYKLFGLKSHDCHVFMERLLPVATRELLPQNVWKALTEISQFFRDLCSSQLKVEDMIRLENNIPEIICKLEKIFPPAFFNSMEHLPVHLPYEAKVGGPVHYRWMYPFERFLYHLKGKIGNKAHVEGSICQAYLTEEISNFCTHYFENKVDTKSRDLSRNLKMNMNETINSNIPDVFRYNIGNAPTKGKLKYLEDRDYRTAHGFILLNCEILSEYERQFEKEMLQTHPRLSADDIRSKFDHEFQSWFKQYVKRSNITDDLLKTLALGPAREVRKWEQYYINGFNFHTYNYGKNKSTMNYGVCVSSPEGVGYYGILQEVIELIYYGSERSYKTVLFKCDWMDSMKGTKRHSHYKLVDVNSALKYPKYDPFVLAFQVEQVYFTPYPSITKDLENWWAVFKVKARSTIEADKLIYQEVVIEDPPSLSEIEKDDMGEMQHEEDHSGNDEEAVEEGEQDEEDDNEEEEEYDYDSYEEDDDVDEMSCDDGDNEEDN